MSQKQHNKSLSQAIKQLIFEEPFYGTFLMSTDKEWSDRLPTMGVGLQNLSCKLLINPEFWESLNEKTRKGLIKHEAMHICLFHLTDFDDLTNKEVRNIAMDLEINQYIDRDSLPEGGVFLDSFPELNLESNKGTRWYYNKLMEQIPPQSGGGGAGGTIIIMQSKQEEEEDQDSQTDFGDGDEQNDGSGNNQNDSDGDGEQEKEENEGQGNQNGSGQGNQSTGNSVIDLINNGQIEGKDGKKTKMPQHDWKEFDQCSDGEKKLIKAQAAYIISEVADAVEKSRGTVPSEIQEILERLRKIEPAKFDWKGCIRKFVGASIKTFAKKTRRKQSKRFDKSPGIRVNAKKHILLALDTSGSVSTAELREFLNEMWHIQKTGADITVLQCDAAIGSVEKFDHRKDFTVTGRGGTDFAPIIEYANEHYRKFSCLIIMTDGEAPAPKKARLRTLWVHSSQSRINDQLIGHKIKLN